MPLIGYARISTGEQTLDPRLVELREAGCALIHEEHASGADRPHPALARLLARIGPGDTLVVVRLDRLARSLVNLLQVIEALEDKGAHFRSMGDPIDTATPQGRFSLQVMGAVAELERALIRERTRAGVAGRARAGAYGGQSGAARGRPRGAPQAAGGARRKLLPQARGRGRGLGYPSWLPLVRRHRPEMAWEDLVRLVGARTGQGWTCERLKRTARRYVCDGPLPAAVLERAPRRDADDRLLAIVAGMRHADPDLTLAGIASRLEQMRESTPRGNAKWFPSTIRLLQRAEKKGMIMGAGDG